MFESGGMPKSSIFRAEVRSMRLIVSMKPTEDADDFGDKKAAGSGEDAHRS